MIPWLLPYSIAIFVVLGLALFAFLKFYKMPSPGTALFLSAGGRPPRVLLRGGTFVSTGTSVEKLDLAVREIAIRFDDDEPLRFPDGAARGVVTIGLRPIETEESLLSLASNLGGAARANDLAVLRERYEPTLRAGISGAAQASSISAVKEPAFEASVRLACAPVTPAFTIDVCNVAVD